MQYKIRHATNRETKFAYQKTNESLMQTLSTQLLPAADAIKQSHRGISHACTRNATSTPSSVPFITPIAPPAPAAAALAQSTEGSVTAEQTRLTRPQTNQPLLLAKERSHRILRIRRQAIEELIRIQARNLHEFPGCRDGALRGVALQCLGFQGLGDESETLGGFGQYCGVLTVESLV